MQVQWPRSNWSVVLSCPEIKSLDSLHKLPLMIENWITLDQLENKTQNLRPRQVGDIFHFLCNNNLSLAAAINIQRNCGEKMVNLQANDRERTGEYLYYIKDSWYLLIECCSCNQNQQSFYIPVVVRLSTEKRKMTHIKKYRFGKYMTSFILT